MMAMVEDTKEENKFPAKKAGIAHLLKTQFARFMHRLILKKSWPFLVIFCITAGGCSVYVLLRSFLAAPVPSIDLGTLKVPVHLHQWREANEPSAAYVDRQTYEQITGFKMYMDSLKLSGAPLYDSIIRSRPHLLDSLAMLEDLYHLQNK
jgi:hypothetical protein